MGILVTQIRVLSWTSSHSPGLTDDYISMEATYKVQSLFHGCNLAPCKIKICFWVLAVAALYTCKIIHSFIMFIEHPWISFHSLNWKMEIWVLLLSGFTLFSLIRSSHPSIFHSFHAIFMVVTTRSARTLSSMDPQSRISIGRHFIHYLITASHGVLDYHPRKIAGHSILLHYLRLRTNLQVPHVFPRSVT